jgi:hypothetical protein
MELEAGTQRLQVLASLAKASAVAVALANIACVISVLLAMNGVVGYDPLPGIDVSIIDAVFILSFVVLLASFFAVGFWLYRAHANAIAADLAALEYTPASAIFWYAIPIANLFKPYGAMKELWQASHREPIDSGQTAPGLIWLWWLTWVFSSINSFSAGESFGLIDVFASAFVAISAGALFVIIDRVTAAQPTMRFDAVFD